MNPNITEMQKQMYYARGHKVRIIFNDGHPPMVGKCTGYTKPIDNDPEVATIDLDIGIPRSRTEITEEEIESIELLD